MDQSIYRIENMARASSINDAHRCPGDVINLQGTARAYPVSDENSKQVVMNLKVAT